MMGSPAAGPIPLRAVQPTSRARSLLAFTGIAPLGAFVLVHVVATSLAQAGPERFGRVFTASPWLAAVTFVLVVVPLLFHGAYGAWVLVRAPRSVQLPTLWPRARRVAAFVLAAFVIGHLAEFGLPRWIGALPAPSLYDRLVADLSSTVAGVPLVALGYVAGLAAALFHFATSTWTFLTTWGLVTRRRRALVWGLGAGVGLFFVLGGSTIVYLATGNRLLGPSPPAFVPDGPPPAPCATQP